MMATIRPPSTTDSSFVATAGVLAEVDDCVAAAADDIEAHHVIAECYLGRPPSRLFVALPLWVLNASVDWLLRGVMPRLRAAVATLWGLCVVSAAGLIPFGGCVALATTRVEGSLLGAVRYYALAMIGSARRCCSPSSSWPRRSRRGGRIGLSLAKDSHNGFLLALLGIFNIAYIMAVIGLPSVMGASSVPAVCPVAPAVGIRVVSGGNDAPPTVLCDLSTVLFSAVNHTAPRAPSTSITTTEVYAALLQSKVSHYYPTSSAAALSATATAMADSSDGGGTTRTTNSAGVEGWLAVRVVPALFYAWVDVVVRPLVGTAAVVAPMRTARTVPASAVSIAAGHAKYSAMGADCGPSPLNGLGPYEHIGFPSSLSSASDRAASPWSAAAWVASAWHSVRVAWAWAWCAALAVGLVAAVGIVYALCRLAIGDVGAMAPTDVLRLASLSQRRAVGGRGVGEEGEAPASTGAPATTSASAALFLSEEGDDVRRSPHQQQTSSFASLAARIAAMNAANDDLAELWWARTHHGKTRRSEACRVATAIIERVASSHHGHSHSEVPLGDADGILSAPPQCDADGDPTATVSKSSFALGTRTMPSADPMDGSCCSSSSRHRCVDDGRRREEGPIQKRDAPLDLSGEPAPRGLAAAACASTATHTAVLHRGSASVGGGALLLRSGSQSAELHLSSSSSANNNGRSVGGSGEEAVAGGYGGEGGADGRARRGMAPLCVAALCFLLRAVFGLIGLIIVAPMLLFMSILTFGAVPMAVALCVVGPCLVAWRVRRSCALLSRGEEGQGQRGAGEGDGGGFALRPLEEPAPYSPFATSADDEAAIKAHANERPRVVTPLSTQYCRACRHHVAGFDHHCTIVGQCIGFHNYPIFLLLLHAVAIGAGFMGAAFPGVYLFTRPLLFAVSGDADALRGSATTSPSPTAGAITTTTTTSVVTAQPYTHEAMGCEALALAAAHSPYSRSSYPSHGAPPPPLWAQGTTMWGAPWPNFVEAMAIVAMRDEPAGNASSLLSSQPSMTSSSQIAASASPSPSPSPSFFTYGDYVLHVLWSSSRARRWVGVAGLAAEAAVHCVKAVLLVCPASVALHLLVGGLQMYVGLYVGLLAGYYTALLYTMRFAVVLRTEGAIPKVTPDGRSVGGGDEEDDDEGGTSNGGEEDPYAAVRDAYASYYAATKADLAAVMGGYGGGALFGGWGPHSNGVDGRAPTPAAQRDPMAIIVGFFSGAIGLPLWGLGRLWDAATCSAWRRGVGYSRLASGGATPLPSAGGRPMPQPAAEMLCFLKAWAYYTRWAVCEGRLMPLVDERGRPVRH